MTLVCYCRDLGGEEAVGCRDNRPADSGGDGPRRREDAQAELRRHQRRGRRQLGGGRQRRQDEPHLAHRQLHPQAQELPLRLRLPRTKRLQGGVCDVPQMQ